MKEEEKRDEGISLYKKGESRRIRAPRNRGRIVLIIAICIAVLGAIIAFRYILSDDASSDEKVVSTSTAGLGGMQEGGGQMPVEEFMLNLSGHMSGPGGIEMPMTVKGEINGNKIERGQAQVDGKTYTMTGEIIDDTYRMVCRYGNEILVVNVMPINGRFEGSATNLAMHYDVVLE